MKNYVAIYNTPTMNNVHYAFTADNMEAALLKAPELIDSPKINVFETDDFGKVVFNSVEEVSSYLNVKYSEIKDFKAYLRNSQTISGGFYKMRYGLEKHTEYFFREIFCKLPKENPNYNDMFNSLDKQMQANLKSQKKSDEAYAKAHDLEVVYKFNYSLIEAQ